MDCKRSNGEKHSAIDPPKRNGLLGLGRYNYRPLLSSDIDSFEAEVAIATRKHDVPSAASDVPFATSNPNDADGYACDDAVGSLPSEPSDSPPLC
jgi:hypothetical protein